MEKIEICKVEAQSHVRFLSTLVTIERDYI